jgi:hypothetical protein
MDKIKEEKKRKTRTCALIVIIFRSGKISPLDRTGKSYYLYALYILHYIFYTALPVVFTERIHM